MGLCCGIDRDKSKYSKKFKLNFGLTLKPVPLNQKT